MSNILFHIDVNSAFLSWSAVDQLKNGAAIDLREIPSIIGGNQKTRHGIVLAKSIPAKKYGIHTGEPVVNAFRKCPNLVMESPDHRMYEQSSGRLMEFLKNYTPDIEQVSIDECYMDFTGIAHLYNNPVEAASQIKDEIYKKFGFTVNIGISSVKLLAKMASDFQKPNQVHTLYPEEISEKMWPLPVAELYMAGKSSVDTLAKLEVKTIGDLAKMDPDILKMHLKSHGQTLWEFANGIDNTSIRTEPAEAKGIGNSTTLSEDIVTMERAKRVLRQLSESVSARLRKSGQKAGMISVEIKYHTFQSVSHQHQLIKCANTNDILFKAACKLYEELWNGEPVRLIGIRTSKLVGMEEPEQLSIFDIPLKQEKNVYGQRYQASDEKHQKVDKAMDEIKKRYGKQAITRGSLLK